MTEENKNMLIKFLNQFIAEDENLEFTLAFSKIGEDSINVSGSSTPVFDTNLLAGLFNNCINNFGVEVIKELFLDSTDFELVDADIHHKEWKVINLATKLASTLLGTVDHDLLDLPNINSVKLQSILKLASKVMEVRDELDD